MSNHYKWLIGYSVLAGCRPDAPPAPTYPQEVEAPSSPVASKLPEPDQGPLEGEPKVKEDKGCTGTNCVSASPALQKQCVTLGFTEAECSRSLWPQDFLDKVMAKAKPAALGSCSSRRVNAEGGLNLRETASSTGKVLGIINDKVVVKVLEAPKGEFVKISGVISGKSTTGFGAVKFLPCADETQAVGSGETPRITTLTCTVKAQPSQEVEISKVTCFNGSTLVKSFNIGEKVTASSAIYTFASRAGVEYRQITVDGKQCYISEKYLECSK